MKKMFLVLLSLVVISMFLLGCKSTGEAFKPLKGERTLESGLSKPSSPPSVEIRGGGGGGVVSPTLSKNCIIINPWAADEAGFLGMPLESVCEVYEKHCVGGEMMTRRYYYSATGPVLAGESGTGKIQLQTFETQWYGKNFICGKSFTQDIERSNYLINSFEQYDEPQAGLYSWDSYLSSVLCCS